MQVKVFQRGRRGLAGHRWPGADRAERHAAAVPGHGQGNQRPAVSPAVQFHFQGNVVVLELGVLAPGREPEAHLVEAAPGGAGAVLDVGVGQGAEFGHPPGGYEQIRRPAAVSQGVVGGMKAHRQGLGGTVGDAEKFVFLTSWPDAQVTFGPPDKFPHLGVHPVGARLHAFAALDALTFVAPDAVLGQGVPETAGGALRVPGGGAPGFVFQLDCRFLGHNISSK